MKRKTSQILNARSIIVAVLAVGAVTGGNLWLHREDPPLGYVEYSDFGFSFIHPQLLPTYSWGYPDSASGANDFGGVVQAKGLWEGVWRNFMVIWSIEAATPDLGAELDDFYALMDSWDCVIDNKGELLSSEKDGHEMLLQTYTFIEDGDLEYIAATGVWCEPWPSLHANRIYTLTYIAYPHLTSRELVLEKLRQYLDTFNGNTAQAT